MNKREAILLLEKKRDKAIGDMSFFGEGSRKGLMNEIRVNTYDIAINTLEQIDEPQAEKVEAHLAEHWHEDIGPVLWWNFPVEEPPYCGTPLDEHFPKYKTHFTTIDMPTEIEQPKQWVVKRADKFFEKFYGYGLRGTWAIHQNQAYLFDVKSKAEAVATLVEGSVEEID